jgi:hypothetical protein
VWKFKLDKCRSEHGGMARFYKPRFLITAIFSLPLNYYIFEKKKKKGILNYGVSSGRLCGVVDRVPGYRSRGRGLIPGATRFSEK